MSFRGRCTLGILHVVFRLANLLAMLGPALAVPLAGAACTTPRSKAAPSLTASADAEVAAAESSASPASPPVQHVAHVPTILVLGDSHTYGAFGHRLHEHLAATGRHAVVSEAAGGATTETYLEERPEATSGYRLRESAPGEHEPHERLHRVHGAIDPLAELLARHDPEIVVVALGTNRPRAPVGESCDAFMQRLVRDRPTRRVFWIGPPAIGPDRRGTANEAVVTSLRATLEKHADATFIDSTTFNASHPLPPDNPHFGPEEARRWADVAFAQIGPKLIAARDAADRP
jgi:hypothetical protein